MFWLLAKHSKKSISQNKIGLTVKCGGGGGGGGGGRSKSPFGSTLSVGILLEVSNYRKLILE